MPFVLGPNLEKSVKLAAELGYDAFELFPPRMDLIEPEKIGQLCQEFDIAISTIGTGGGAVSQGLTLTDPDASIRERGKEYIRDIIETAGDLGAAAIVGSMQGRAGDRDKHEMMKILCDALAELGEFASKWDQPLLYEPLNRYETDLANTLADAAEALRAAGAKNALLLADLFHMNIEEVSIQSALKMNQHQIGHIHFVDSNRWPMGCGHTDGSAIVATLRELNYDGYLAVEAFPLPDQAAAAQAAMTNFKELGVVQ